MEKVALGALELGNCRAVCRVELLHANSAGVTSVHVGGLDVAAHLGHKLCPLLLLIYRVLSGTFLGDSSTNARCHAAAAAEKETSAHAAARTNRCKDCQDKDQDTWSIGNSSIVVIGHKQGLEVLTVVLNENRDSPKEHADLPHCVKGLDSAMSLEVLRFCVLIGDAEENQVLDKIVSCEDDPQQDEVETTRVRKLDDLEQLNLRDEEPERNAEPDHVVEYLAAVLFLLFECHLLVGALTRGATELQLVVERSMLNPL